MVYRIVNKLVAVPITLSDLQAHLSIVSLFNCEFFVQLCSSWQNFNWHGSSRGPSLGESFASCLYETASFAWTCRYNQTNCCSWASFCTFYPQICIHHYRLKLAKSWLIVDSS